MMIYLYTMFRHYRTLATLLGEKLHHYTNTFFLAFDTLNVNNPMKVKH